MMRSHWLSFVTGALFGSASVVFLLQAQRSRRIAASLAPATTIDEVRPPGPAELALQSPPEVKGHDFPLESEIPDVDPVTERW